MDKKVRWTFLVITYTVFLIAVVLNLNHVFSFFQDIVGMVLPILTGGLLAFVVSVPMNGFEKGIRKLCRKGKKTPKDGWVQIMSLCLTLLSIILVGVLVSTIAIPQIVSSIKGIWLLVEEKWPEWARLLKSYHIDTAPITEWLETLEFGDLFVDLASQAGVLLGTLAGTAASTISVFITGAIAVVVMFYILISKEKLARQSKKLLYAYTKKEFADKAVHVGTLIRETYTKFLTGQCVEAVILGVLMFVAFSLFRLPYAGLVSLLTSVFSFVPYVGAFLACGIGVLLTLLSDPVQAIICLIVYQVVQFIENHFIYPRVVGNSVGLSPLWTLIAALIGGKLFGLIGMIFFIPLTAIIYTLLQRDANQRLKTKGIHVP